MGGWTLTSDAAAVMRGVRSWFGDVDSIEQDAIAVGAGLEAHLSGVGERVQRGGIAGGDSGVERFEGEGAIHGAAFDIEQAEALGERAGDGALPCTGGAIDGDDERGNGERLAFAHLISLLRRAHGIASPSLRSPVGSLCSSSLHPLRGIRRAACALAGLSRRDAGRPGADLWA